MPDRPRRRQGAAALAGAVATLATALVAAVLPAGSAQADDPAAIPATASIRFDGQGFGHGRGLSQYGARGAARQGLSYRQILAFYYPGTSYGSEKGKVSVEISADTDKFLVVEPRPRLTVRPVGQGRSIVLSKAKPQAKKWRLHRASDGHTSVEFRTDRWRVLTKLKGEGEFFAGGQPITLRLPGGGAVAYRGILRSATSESSRSRDTVNILPMDAYLQGVVPTEMPAEWEGEALRAQAVAARTYAAYEVADGSPRICDTTACQVYGGFSAEEPQTNRAVERTAGKILTYDGGPAFTQFSSSNGGASAAGAFPYLVAQSDPYEASSDNPSRVWTVDFTDTEIEAAYPSIGNLTSITLANRNGLGSWGGRIGLVTVTGSAGSTTVTGEDFRSVLNLRSSWFTLTVS